jgi:endonuclease/exonuclease/phosphatase family metal-dependent hydrolase
MLPPLTGTGALRLARTTLVLLGALALGSAAQAQSLTLTGSSDTTLRGGAYANTNYGTSTTLETRASGTADYIRRVIVKFDTHNTIPQGSAIASAKLTLTIKGGNSETRTLTVYRVTQPYTDTEATWKIRRTSTSWSNLGGDLGEKAGTLTVTNTAGAKVTIDITSLVQKIVNGTYGSTRYTRLALVDEGASSQSSYKQYYSEQAGSGLGPVLSVVLGTTASAPTPSTGSTLKVMDWNIHHGTDTGGGNNLDRVASKISQINPHVVSLNEVELKNGYNGNADEPAVLKSYLQSKTGKTWYSCFAQRTGSSTGQGNLILSRIPISSCDKYYMSGSRSVANAAITVNGRTVNVFSTHLDESSASMRTTEISQLKSWASGRSEQRIIMGDFNAWPGATEIAGMTSAYYDSWAEAQSKNVDITYSGNSAGNTRNSRIDYVWRSHGATSLVLTEAQVYDTGSISDHRPVSATFTVK